jgi:CheY-like chemotaxis protein
MMKIIILEDNRDRQAEMRRCLQDRFHQYEAVIFDEAKEMVAYLEGNLKSALIISLDHDLELVPQPNGKLLDSGTGREVADFLAQRKPACPVIIHTTNSAAGDGMEFLLREAHWETHRVHPYGDLEWISGAWLRTLRNAVVASARPRAQKEKNGQGPGIRASGSLNPDS